MRIFNLAALAAAVALAGTLAIPSDADASKRRPLRCGNFTGQGSGLTDAAATAFAKVAVADAVKKAGNTARGAEKVACTRPFPYVASNCTVTQRACKR